MPWPLESGLQQTVVVKLTASQCSNALQPSSALPPSPCFRNASLGYAASNRMAAENNKRPLVQLCKPAEISFRNQRRTTSDMLGMPNSCISFRNLGASTHTHESQRPTQHHSRHTHTHMHMLHARTTVYSRAHVELVLTGPTCAEWNHLVKDGVDGADRGCVEPVLQQHPTNGDYDVATTSDQWRL